ISAEEVFRRYRGFDSEPWPMEGHTSLHGEDGLGDPSELRSIEEYAGKLPSTHESDIILLVRRGPSDEDTLRLGWECIGFDVGFFESEWSHYSVILSEVIWGTIGELRSFAGKLNEHLLLNDIGDAQALVRRHDVLASQGEDVEVGEMEPFAIYVPV